MTSFTPAPAHPFSEGLLAAVREFTPYTADTALAAASALRSKGLSPEETSTVLTQAKLRTQASSKFGERAIEMLLTEAGYEQATRAAVGAHHAQRFVDAGISSVADLGCGIGADSLAFAAAGLAVTGVELDPATAALTAHNLRRFKSSQVLVGNIEEVQLENLNTVSGQPVEALWLDPARREVEGGATTSRLFDPEAFSPPLSFVEKLATTGIPMGVKMGPGLPHEHIPEGVEAEWVSHGGSVVEVVFWFNALARPGLARSATVLGADATTRQVLGELSSSVPATAPDEPVEVRALGAYLIEPDGAVVRSHLVADLARAIGATLLDENIAYLTSDSPAPSPLGRAYRVRATLPLNEKKLRRWVKEEGITSLTIKKRGVDVVPEKLRATLLAGVKKKKGATSKEATLILTRLGQGAESQRLAIWAEPA